MAPRTDKPEQLKKQLGWVSSSIHPRLVLVVLVVLGKRTNQVGATDGDGDGDDDGKVSN